MSDKNVKRHKDYTQVCIWPGTSLPEGQEQDLVDFFQNEMATRIQFLEVIFTEPDRGDTDPEAGGRSDVFFAVHKEDIQGFALKRLQMGIRWIEDVLAKCNYSSPIYPNRIYDYRTWEA